MRMSLILNILTLAPLALILRLDGLVCSPGAWSSFYHGMIKPISSSCNKAVWWLWYSRILFSAVKTCMVLEPSSNFSCFMTCEWGVPSIYSIQFNSIQHLASMYAMKFKCAFTPCGPVMTLAKVACVTLWHKQVFHAGSFFTRNTRHTDICSFNHVDPSSPSSQLEFAQCTLTSLVSWRWLLVMMPWSSWVAWNSFLF